MMQEGKNTLLGTRFDTWNTDLNGTKNRTISENSAFLPHGAAVPNSV
jgi:hypothetical protein